MNKKQDNAYQKLVKEQKKLVVSHVKLANEFSN